MSFDGSVRYAWSPNIAWRVINTIFGIVFLGITFGISVGITAKILLFIAGVITLCYGIAGIIRRPRLISTCMFAALSVTTFILFILCTVSALIVLPALFSIHPC